MTSGHHEPDDGMSVDKGITYFAELSSKMERLIGDAVDDLALIPYEPDVPDRDQLVHDLNGQIAVFRQVREFATRRLDDLRQQRDADLDAMEVVGRNEPCPCGSGRKYKHCHGAPA